MEGVGSVRFGHGMHFGGGDAPLMGMGMMPAGMGSLLLGAGMGMPAAGVSLGQPGGYLPSAAGYGGAIPNNAMHAWNGVVGRQQQPQAGRGYGVRPTPHRGPWTEEEDATLKAMVNIHGERKWAVICKYLPGRIGKQCRERWTNHLRPDIDKAKSIWTEDDDLQLIESHKKHGNRWSVIARDLVGRSENSVKNHWNATKRSLRARRRLKKKKNAEARPGQKWSILEQYIRSLQPPADGAARGGRGAPLPPPADPLPSPYNPGYGEVVSPIPEPVYDPAALGLYLSAAASNDYSSSSAASVNYMGAMDMEPIVAAPPPPPLPYLGLDLNSYYYYYGEPVLAAREPEMMDQEQQAAALYADSLLTYHQFVDSMAWQPSVLHAVDAAYADNTSANEAQENNNYYYGDAGAGPSGITGGISGDGNIDDVVGMASREFLSLSEEEVTLNLAGFM